jgi:nucleoside phosphorylase
MQVDVLIITALQEELNAVLRLGENGEAGWSIKYDPSGYRYHERTFPLPKGESLNAAVAWSGMGETAAAGRAHGLISLLSPLSIAMCGICAGRRGDVFLGDVIVADRVFSYDHGKLVASTENGHRVEKIFHDIETYNLDKSWAMEASYFRESWRFPEERPISLDYQRAWALHRLFEHQVEGSDPPYRHPDVDKLCPRWSDVMKSLASKGLARIDAGNLVLTEQGEKIIREERIRNRGKLPEEPPFRVHVGPIATGKTVRQDPELFQSIAQSTRKVLGVEMEAAAIGWVAEFSGLPYIIAKAVSDYGDADKDDGFREFASSASARFLIDFLLHHPPRRLIKDRTLGQLPKPVRDFEAVPRQDDKAIEPLRVAAAPPGVTTLSTPEERSKDRQRTYETMRKVFLVHVLTPSAVRGQKYDIYIYIKRHRDEDIDDVERAEFFFGKSWSNRIFPGKRAGNRLGVQTSAYGPFLCTCRVTFKDGATVMLYRYIDFEMGGLVDAQAAKQP